MSVLFAAGMLIGAFDETTVSTHDPSTCPRHAAHQAAGRPDQRDHRRQVDLRHDAATGVAHGDSVHHFELAARGGNIRLEVADAKDTAGRDRIRAHLATIAREFAQGRFDLPMRIHDQTPPGVETMRRLKSAIRYRYAPTPRGGRVEISTEDAEALAAIHEFLRFQIDEHRTADRSF
jgi:hypothetical protein